MQEVSEPLDESLLWGVADRVACREGAEPDVDPDDGSNRGDVLEGQLRDEPSLEPP